jgi:hypothetical protein
MANLNEFQSDMKSITEGIWIRVHEAYGDLEILVKGFTDDFHDARTARTEIASEPYGGNEKKIPNHEQRRINASLMKDYLIIGVRNLKDGEGNDVTLEQFHRFLFQNDYGRLSRMCWEAAGRVSARSMAQVELATKNSPADFASN